MSCHIVSIDAPDRSLSCKDGQLTCKSAEEDRSVPLEDVAAIIIISFSASIHSKLLLEAAKQGQVRMRSSVSESRQAVEAACTRHMLQHCLPSSFIQRVGMAGKMHGDELFRIDWRAR